MIQLNEVLIGIVTMVSLGFFAVSVYMVLTEDARQAKRKAYQEAVDWERYRQWQTLTQQERGRRLPPPNPAEFQFITRPR